MDENKFDEQPAEQIPFDQAPEISEQDVKIQDEEMEKEQLKEREETKRNREEEKRKKIQYEHHRKSLWDRIKAFFKRMYDRLTFFTISRETKASLERQYIISADRERESKEKQEEIRKQQLPEKLYVKYIMPECAYAHKTIEDRITNLAAEYAQEDGKISIPIPDGHSIEISNTNIENTQDIETDITVLDKNGKPEFSSVVTIKEKGTVEIGDITKLTEFLQNPHTFEVPNKELIKERVEEIKQDEKKEKEYEKDGKTKEEAQYKNLCMKYKRNPFSMSLYELETMIKLVVENDLDKNNDTNEKGKPIYSKGFSIIDKTGVQISAYVNTHEDKTYVSYSSGSKNTGNRKTYKREEIEEILKSAQKIKYNITTEMEKDKEIKELVKCRGSKNIRPYYNLNVENMSKKAQEFMEAAKKDGQVYPDELTDKINQAIQTKDVAVLSRYIDMASVLPEPNTMEVTRSIIKTKNRAGYTSLDTATNHLKDIYRETYLKDDKQKVQDGEIQLPDLSAAAKVALYSWYWEEARMMAPNTDFALAAATKFHDEYEKVDETELKKALTPSNCYAINNFHYELHKDYEDVFPEIKIEQETPAPEQPSGSQPQPEEPTQTPEQTPETKPQTPEPEQIPEPQPQIPVPEQVPELPPMPNEVSGQEYNADLDDYEGEHVIEEAEEDALMREINKATIEAHNQQGRGQTQEQTQNLDTELTV